MSASAIARSRLSRRSSRDRDSPRSFQSNLEPLIADDTPKETAKDPMRPRRASTPERFRRAMSKMSIGRRKTGSQPNAHGIYFKSSQAHLGDAETVVVRHGPSSSLLQPLRHRSECPNYPSRRSLRWILALRAPATPTSTRKATLRRFSSPRASGGRLPGTRRRLRCCSVSRATSAPSVTTHVRHTTTRPTRPSSSSPT